MALSSHYKEIMDNDLLHVSENHLLTDLTHDGSMNDRLFHVKSRGMEMMDSMRSRLTITPLQLAGIATGAGFGLGLIGRIIRYRSRRNVKRRVMILEGTC